MEDIAAVIGVVYVVELLGLKDDLEMAGIEWPLLTADIYPPKLPQLLAFPFFAEICSFEPQLVDIGL